MIIGFHGQRSLVMFKSKLSRECLFESDEYASSWAEQQAWRLSKLKQTTSLKTGVPQDQLRLVYEEKIRRKLISRDGDSVVYRPSGILISTTPPSKPGDSMIFDVSWVDPWGFPHKDTKSFLELRFMYVDMITYHRKEKDIRRAWDRLTNKLA